MTSSSAEDLPTAVLAYAVGIEATRFDRRAASFSTETDTLLPSPSVRSALWADRDAFMEPDISRRTGLVQAAHPTAPQKIVPTSGHWLQLDAHGEATQWLLRQTDRNAQAADRIGNPCNGAVHEHEERSNDLSVDV